LKNEKTTVFLPPLPLRRRTSAGKSSCPCNEKAAGANSGCLQIVPAATGLEAG
jgi:hypothetical protein